MKLGLTARSPLIGFGNSLAAVARLRSHSTFASELRARTLAVLAFRLHSARLQTIPPALMPNGGVSHLQKRTVSSDTKRLQSAKKSFQPHTAFFGYFLSGKKVT